GSALRGAQAGRVAVEDEDQLAGAGALDDLEVFLRERRAAGRHRALHAGLVQPDGVEISLDEKRYALAADRLARLVQREEDAALRVQRRIRRVEILRVALSFEEPSAERDRPSGLADGNDQPAAEPVVETLLLLARHAQPRLLGILRLEIDAGLGGKLLGRLAEALPVELHDELDRVAGRAAPEAVEDLLVGHDVEAGRLLSVEWAEALPVPAGLLQPDAALHHRDDVDTVAQLLQLLVADSRQSAPVKRPRRSRSHHEPLAARAA